MKLPKDEVDVLVKLDNGSFAVAQYCAGSWYAGEGVYSSHEDGRDILSGKVVAWSDLPDTLENQLNSHPRGNRLN